MPEFAPKQSGYRVFIRVINIDGLEQVQKKKIERDKKWIYTYTYLCVTVPSLFKIIFELLLNTNYSLLYSKYCCYSYFLLFGIKRKVKFLLNVIE